jgi:hypothetical protein
VNQRLPRPSSRCPKTIAGLTPIFVTTACADARRDDRGQRDGQVADARSGVRTGPAPAACRARA